MKQKMLSRAPTVLLIITPFADAQSVRQTQKNAWTLNAIHIQERFSQLTAISRMRFYLWLYFTSASLFSFILLARKRSFSYIYYLHIAHSNIANINFVISRAASVAKCEATESQSGNNNFLSNSAQARIGCSVTLPLEQIKFRSYSNKAKRQIDVPRMSIWQRESSLPSFLRKKAGKK